MKNERQKYGLKLRGSTNSYQRTTQKNRSFANKMTNSAIICISILIIVSFIKMSDNTYAKGILSKLDSLLSSQMDIAKTADDVVNFVSSAVSKLTGKEISVISGNVEKFSSPVQSGTITQKFEDTIHPVYKTVVKPTGIKIATVSSAYIYSASSGTVTNIIDNTDGTKRVVIAYDKNTNIVYDFLSNVYIKKDDKVDEKQIIGIMPEGNAPELQFEIWVNNEAKDPTTYIGEISQQ